LTAPGSSAATTSPPATSPGWSMTRPPAARSCAKAATAQGPELLPLQPAAGPAARAMFPLGERPRPTP
jgi:hypothetical protein